MFHSRSLLALLPLLALPVLAQDAPKDHTVKSGPFRNQIAVDGVLLPAMATPVKIDPKQWKTLSLKSLAQHGTSVKKGDVIASFDVEALEEHVKKVTRGRESAKLQLDRVELELAAIRKTTPLDLEATRRAAAQAKESLENWHKIWRPLEIEENDQNLKNAEQMLLSAKEELNQLEKMYSAKDMTEETEEFILKRTRWSVEKAEFTLKQMKEVHPDVLKIRIPKIDKDRQEAAERTAIALDRGEKDYAAVLKLKELEVAERRVAFEKEEKDFAELKADLEMLAAVKAPADGVVLWADWTGTDGATKYAEFDKKYAATPRACVVAQDVLATIVSGTPARVAAKLAPDARGDIAYAGPAPEEKAAANRYVTLESTPEKAIPVKIVSIANQPDAQGRLPVILSLPADALAGKGAATPAAGTKTKVVLSDYRKDDAVTIPAAFIDTAFDGGSLKESVLVKAGDGAPQRREIQTGQRNAKGVEVVNGLKAGEILAPLP